MECKRNKIYSDYEGFPAKYNMHSNRKSHIRSVALENFEDQRKLNTQHPGKIQTFTIWAFLCTILRIHGYSAAQAWIDGLQSTNSPLSNS